MGKYGSRTGARTCFGTYPGVFGHGEHDGLVKNDERVSPEAVMLVSCLKFEFLRKFG